MSRRLRYPAKSSTSLAFEALEPRALLAAVADWWEDVGQWATPAWWSEESWWDDSSWWGDQASAGDWSAEEPVELGDEVELVDAVDLVTDVSGAGSLEVDEPGAASSTPIVADDVAETLSDVEAIARGDDPQACGADDPHVCESAGLPELGQASISEEPREKATDSLLAGRAEKDPIVAVVAPDVDGSVSEADERVAETFVTKDAEHVDATVTVDSDVVEHFTTPVPPLPPIGPEPVATHVAQPVSEGISDVGSDHVVPRPDEQPGVVAAPAVAFGTPVAAVAGTPMSAIPLSVVVAIEPALPRVGGMSSAAIAARRLAMWAGLMGPVSVSGPGGAAGESSIGAGGLTTALPVAGRPRSRLPVRRVG